MRKLFLCLFSICFLNSESKAQFADDELPAITGTNARAFFIPATVCAKFKVNFDKSDLWMRSYSNNGNDAKLQQVFDIRWKAFSNQHAMDWYKSHTELLSEKGTDITVDFPKPGGVNAWNVYEASADVKKTMETLGMKQNQYTFTFVVDKYVAKIFVGVNDATSAQESWNFVKEGVKAVLRASGKQKLALLIR